MLIFIRQFFIASFLTLFTGYGAAAILAPGEVGAKSYILLEADSGLALTEYHADERVAPASITKLMTAYVVYQSIANGIIALEDKTTISPRARQMEGSRMFLEQGSHVSIDNLLSGLVVQSGNDAAVALAEAVAGDEKRFVDIMNKQAKALNMINSHFMNVTGLPHDDHYMSARDIATLSLAIIKDFPENYKRYSRKRFTWNNITQDNRNTLLFTNPNVDGLKTGHTNAAGYCLAASAKRGNMRLVSVVLGTQSMKARTTASQKLLTFGFDNFRNQTLYQAGQQLTRSAVTNGKSDSVGLAPKTSIRLPLPLENPTQGLKAQLMLNSALVAPIEKNATVGKFNIQKDGNGGRNWLF